MMLSACRRLFGGHAIIRTPISGAAGSRSPSAYNYETSKTFSSPPSALIRKRRVELLGTILIVILILLLLGVLPPGLTAETGVMAPAEGWD